MRPLVIFLAIDELQGLTYHLAGWVKALTKIRPADFDFVPVTVAAAQEPGLHDDVRRAGVCCSLITGLSELRPYLAKADIVHCQGFRQLLRLFRVRRRERHGFKILVTVNSYRNGTRSKMIAAALFGSLAKLAGAGMHFLSRAAERDFWHWNISKVGSAIEKWNFPLGVDLEEFVEPVVPQDPVLREQIESSRNGIVYLAHYLPNKAHAWLIDALEEVLRDLGAKLWLPGEGPELEAIRGLVARRGLQSHVVIPGRIPRRWIPFLLSHMTLAVFCSRSENSPHGLMEPLAAGLPVVSTDVGTASELIRDFASGFVVTGHRSKKEFARKVELLIRDVHLRQAVRSRLLVDRRSLDWTVCAENTWRMYRASLGTRPVRSRSASRGVQ